MSRTFFFAQILCGVERRPWHLARPFASPQQDQELPRHAGSFWLCFNWLYGSLTDRLHPTPPATHVGAILQSPFHFGAFCCCRDHNPRRNVHVVRHRSVGVRRSLSVLLCYFSESKERDSRKVTCWSHKGFNQTQRELFVSLWAGEKTFVFW